MQGAKTDYLESQAILSGIYTTFIVPAGVLYFIRSLCEEKRFETDTAAGIVAWQYPLAVFQSIGMTFLIFVSWKTSPIN